MDGNEPVQLYQIMVFEFWKLSFIFPSPVSLMKTNPYKSPWLRIPNPFVRCTYTNRKWHSLVPLPEHPVALELFLIAEFWKNSLNVRSLTWDQRRMIQVSIRLSRAWCQGTDNFFSRLWNSVRPFWLRSEERRITKPLRLCLNSCSLIPIRS